MNQATNPPLKDALKKAVRIFWRVSISLKLAVSIILGLTLSLIVATILESMYDTPTAQYWVYQSWFFYGLLGLLGWLIFSVAMSRLPWQKKHLPFLCAHLGILLLLYGSWVTYKFGIDGTIQVSEGRMESSIELNEPLLLIAEDAGAGASHSYPLPWIPPNGTFRPVKIPEFGIAVEDYISRAEMNVNFAAAAAGEVGTAPALRLKIAGGPSAPPFMRMGQETWVFGGDPSWSRQQVGPAIVSLSPGTDFLPVASGGPEASFRLDEKKSELVALIRTSEGKKKEFRYPFKDPKELVGKSIETGWKFEATISILEWIPRAVSDVGYVPARIQFGANVPPSAIRLSAGNSKVWLGLGDRATLEVPPRPDESRKSRLLTIGYFPRRVVLPFGIRLKKFEIGRYQGTMNPSEFSSIVDVEGGPREGPKDRLISMNEPMEHGGFTFYQASYVDAEPRPTTSIFSVNQDPGRWLKYLGSLLIVLGSIWLFTMRYLSKVPKKSAKGTP